MPYLTGQLFNRSIPLTRTAARFPSGSPGFWSTGTLDGVKVDNPMEMVSMGSGGAGADGGNIASSSRKVRACSFFRDPEGERIFLGLHHESGN